VTAERTETLLRRTPVSEGVIGAQEIDTKAIRQLSDIVGVVAGVTVPNGFSNQPQAVGIRGVGVSIPAMRQAVGIYVDDVPLVRGYATALWDLPDIERIEVLRGPQGTLYGQNLTAGAIKLVSIDPGADPVAWVSASLGNFGEREAHGYANGRLGGGPLSGSFAFSRRSNDGFGYNATLAERVNKLDATQFRAKLRLTATPDVDAVLAVDGLQDRSDTNTTNFPLNAPQTRARVTYTSADVGAFERDAGGVSLKLGDRLGPNLMLRSISAFRAYRDDPSVVDFGGLVIQRFGIAQTVAQRVLSQELQLQGHQAALDWTAGVMLVGDVFDFHRHSTQFPLPAPAPIYTEAQTHQRTVDAGLYGQANYALDAQTHLTAGLRVYRTRQTALNQFWDTDVDQARTKSVYVTPKLSTTRDGVLPRLGIDRQWTPDVFVYASVAQGAKFGGFNRAAQSLTSAEVAANPEKVTTYEAGGKGRFADGRVTANIAIFYNDYRDYLASLTNTTINGVLVTDSVLVNAGKASTYGVDFEAAAKLTRLTDWTLTLEALRTRIDSFENPTGAPSGDFVGNQLPYAPRLSAGSSIHHELPFADGSSLTLNASVQYSATQFSDVANTPRLKIPAQTYFNLAAGYMTAARHWSFSLKVKNLTNRTYVLLRQVIPPLGVDAGFYDSPRTVLATARYDF